MTYILMIITRMKMLLLLLERYCQQLHELVLSFLFGLPHYTLFLETDKFFIILYWICHLKVDVQVISLHLTSFFPCTMTSKSNIYNVNSNIVVMGICNYARFVFWHSSSILLKLRGFYYSIFFRLCCRLLVIGRVLTGLVTSLLHLMKH